MVLKLFKRNDRSNHAQLFYNEENSLVQDILKAINMEPKWGNTKFLYNRLQS